MSLDVTIKERKEFRCPDCGRLVATWDITEERSDYRVWYDFLKSVGYYVEDENQTDWYGKDMVLTDEQVEKVYQFVRENQDLYKSLCVEHILAAAIFENNNIVVNADW